MSSGHEVLLAGHRPNQALELAGKRSAPGGGAMPMDPVRLRQPVPAGSPLQFTPQIICLSKPPDPSTRPTSPPEFMVSTAPSIIRQGEAGTDGGSHAGEFRNHEPTSSRSVSCVILLPQDLSPGILGCRQWRLER